MKFRPVWLAPALLLPIFLNVRAQDPPAAASASDKPAAATQECDTALGKRVFGQCSICHSVEKGVPPAAGPNLNGVVGRTAASAPGFSYSKAMRESAKQWSPQELEHFLEQPMTYIPGTTMAFAGLRKPAERAAVICYLAQSK